MSYMRVRQNWIDGLWDKQQIKLAYQKGIITKEQYREIIALPRKGERPVDE